MKATVQCVTICLAFCVPALRAGAATYYVDPGGSDGSDGSEGRPWRSISHACRMVGQGNTIRVNAGEYVEDATCQVPCGVELAGAGPERTLVRGRADPLVSVQNCGGAATAVSGLFLDGQNRSAGSVGLDIDNVSGLTVHDIHASYFGGGGGIRIRNATGSEIYGCVLTNNGSEGNYGCSGTMGVGSLDNCSVHDMLLYDEVAYAIKGLGGTIVNTEFYNIRMEVTAKNCSAWNNLAFELYKMDLENVDIHHCYITNVVSLIPQDTRNPRAGPTTVRLHHNVFDDQYGSPAIVKILLGEMRNSVFCNNTVVLRSDAECIGLMRGVNVGITNNIFCSASGDIGGRLGDVGGSDVERNCFYNIGPAGNVALDADPLLPLSGGFPRAYIPDEGSPVVDAGVEIDGYTGGFAGSAPDIGAFEAGSAGWQAGPEGPVLLPFFIVLQAEAFDAMSNVSEDGTYVGDCDDGGWLRFDNVNLGEGYAHFTAFCACDPDYAGQAAEVRLDAPDGERIGSLDIQSTGGWDAYDWQRIELSPHSATHAVYIVFRGTQGRTQSVGNFDWFMFSNTVPTAVKRATAPRPFSEGGAVRFVKDGVVGWCETAPAAVAVFDLRGRCLSRAGAGPGATARLSLWPMSSGIALVRADAGPVRTLRRILVCR